MNDEILKVLEMVKDGKITAEEGEMLIAAMSSANPGTESEQSTRNKPKHSMLRIRVDARDPDKKDDAKVTVNVPLKLARKAAGLLSLIPKDAKKELSDKGIDLDSINLKELIELFELGELDEELVNIKAGDDEKGATVRIYVD
jgi:polyhydroxyalkanoate synthesis regulator phasin